MYTNWSTTKEEKIVDGGDYIDKTSSSIVDKDFVNNFCRIKATSNKSKAKQWFSHFDENQDGFLGKEEFFTMVRALFTDDVIDKNDADFMFRTVDKNQDGKIDNEEFALAWTLWLSQILDPVTALIIVDVQNDFISGSLALKNCPAGEQGEEVVPVINSMMQNVDFDAVVYTLDWHPDNHVSFHKNVCQRSFHQSSKVQQEESKMFDAVVFDQSYGPCEQVLWPSHCVQKSTGAELHPDLKVHPGGVTVYKGTNPEVDSYSAFWDNMKLNQTDLLQQLTDRGVTDVFVCGLATDICVGFTTLHALEHGFRVTLVEDASRGVNKDHIADVKRQVVEKGGVVADSQKVLGLAVCKERRLVHGKRACETFATARAALDQSATAQKEILARSAAPLLTAVTLDS